MADLDSAVTWSEDLFSVKESVNKLGLPCMVKVVNGCTHADFSEGHLLKLDFGIAIKKVAACFVSKRPDSGDKTNNIFIPLGYEGKVRIAREDAGNKIYTSLKDLIEDFPRYVQAEEGFSSTEDGSGKTLAIPTKAKLELDKAIGVANLYCKFNDKTILLTSKDKIKFRLLADDTTYTLQEVVDRLHFPQTVRFLDPQFQMVAKTDLNGESCGTIGDTLELSRVTSHEVIVGLLRPSVIPTCGPGSVKKKVQPTLALFPLQASAAVNDIKVKAAVDKNDKSYKSTMAKLFPQTVDRTLIQESFYVDMASKVNIHIQKDNRWITVKPAPVKKVSVPSPVDIPPPLPKGREERKMSPRAKTPTSPSKEKIQLSPRDTKSPTMDDSPKSPKDKDGNKNKKDKDKKDKEKKKNKCKESPRASSAGSGRSNTPSSLHIPTDEEVLPIAPSTPSPSPPLPPDLPKRNMPRKPPPSTTDKPNKPTQMPLPDPSDYETPLSNTKAVSPVTSQGQENEYLGLAPSAAGGHYSELQDEGIYDDLIMDREEPNTKKDKEKDKDKKKKGFKFFTGGRKKKHEVPRTSVTEVATEPLERSTMPIDKVADISSIGKKTKPVGTVRPNSQSLPEKTEKPTEFKSFTVVKLVECLRQCGLPDLAKLCEEEKLDGDFLSTLSATDLTKEPFSLNPLHLKKLERIKDGWRPTE
ncbi:proteoglycan 4-like [Ylistrum balloti]|uniref:proteoglycan 4-like n=1 Tax=Ylistrum balloti TaxID=509963 RepID=UPI002905CDB2|nr:proteoglycan 4-like [Ylistrum balloti]